MGTDPVKDTTRFSATYWRDGYAVARKVLPERVLGRLQENTQEIVEEHAQGLAKAGRVSRLYHDLPFEERLVALHREQRVLLTRWGERLNRDVVRALVTSPALLRSLELLLGPTAVCHGDVTLRPKLPGSADAALPWHQDSHYYGAMTRHLHIVTVWVPLVDAREMNGGLSVIPGTHRGPLLKARKAGGRLVVPRDLVEDDQARSLFVRRGDVLFMHNLLVHCSGVNRSRGVRWSVDFSCAEDPKHGSWTRNERAGQRQLYGWLDARRMTPWKVGLPPPEV